jgi:PadR family transcriptional regulator PadR
MDSGQYIDNRCIMVAEDMAKTSLQSSGNLVGLVLAVLNDEPLHGYGIAREIEKRSADALSFGEGTLYPVLKTLERDGFVEGRWLAPADRGPARKVYDITPEGREELFRIREAWQEYSRSIDRVFESNPTKQRA